MKKTLKTFFATLVFILGISVSSFSSITSAGTPPSFDKDFASHLANSESDISTVNIEKVSADRSLKDNIRALIYPNPSDSGVLGNAIKNLAIGVILVFLVVAGAQLVIS